jgi:hypothetical protein
MHLNRMRVVAAVVLAAAMGASIEARAALVITNTGYVDYANEALVAQTAVVGNTVFVVAANPVLTVAKTRDVARGPAGTVVTFSITVNYPQNGPTCGDDSNAKTVIVRDTLPTGLKFRNVAATDFRVYDGTAWSNVTIGTGDDAGDISIGANDIITANLTYSSDFAECGAARIVEFKAVVQ